MRSVILILFLFTLLSCGKDSFSPQEQVVEAIHSQLKYIPDSPRFFLLRNEVLCEGINCDVERFLAKGSTVVIYSREDLFMRAIDLYFEVVEWKESPRVIIRNHTGKQLSDELIIQRCKGT